MRYPRRGFTLIELLVVIAIIADSHRAPATSSAKGSRGGRAHELLEQPPSNSASPCTNYEGSVSEIPAAVSVRSSWCDQSG